MGNGQWSRFIYVNITLFVLQGMSIASSALAACYSTPGRAVEAFITGSSPIPTVSKNGGYQVKGIESDPLLGRSWATVASCSHPEWPALAVPAAGAGAKYSLIGLVEKAPLVRAGDTVRLWRQESLLRIELTGISEENGEIGKTVRVRLLRSNKDDQSKPEQYSGVVRGPSDVEMQP